MSDSSNSNVPTILGKRKSDHTDGAMELERLMKIFRAECISKWLTSKETCPCCRKMLLEKQLITDVRTERKSANHPRCCKYKNEGCNFIGTRNEMMAHNSTCQYELIEEQRNELQRSISLHLILLQHSVTCAKCKSKNCAKMKEFLSHNQTCTAKSMEEGCKLCLRIMNLVTIHARRCKQENSCKVPHCVEMKEQLSTSSTPPRRSDTHSLFIHVYDLPEHITGEPAVVQHNPKLLSEPASKETSGTVNEPVSDRSISADRMAPSYSIQAAGETRSHPDHLPSRDPTHPIVCRSWAYLISPPAPRRPIEPCPSA
eukprot:gene35875-48245_t